MEFFKDGFFDIAPMEKTPFTGIGDSQHTWEVHVVTTYSSDGKKDEILAEDSTEL